MKPLCQLLHMPLPIKNELKDDAPTPMICCLSKNQWNQGCWYGALHNYSFQVVLLGIVVAATKAKYTQQDGIMLTRNHHSLDIESANPLVLHFQGLYL